MGFIHEVPEKKTLRVIRKSGMTPDFDALEHGVRRFIGVKMTHDLDSDGKPGPDHGKFATTDHEETVSRRKEHLQAIAEGHLVAVDDETAKAALPYARKPSIGRNPPDHWKWFLATDEEKRLSEETLAEHSEAAKKNEAEAKVAAKPADSPKPADDQA